MDSFLKFYELINESRKNRSLDTDWISQNKPSEDLRAKQAQALNQDIERSYASQPASVSAPTMPARQGETGADVNLRKRNRGQLQQMGRTKKGSQNKQMVPVASIDPEKRAIAMRQDRIRVAQNNMRTMIGQMALRKVLFPANEEEKALQSQLLNPKTIQWLRSNPLNDPNAHFIISDKESPSGHVVTLPNEIPDPSKENPNQTFNIFDDILNGYWKIAAQKSTIDMPSRTRPDVEEKTVKQVGEDETGMIKPSSEKEQKPKYISELEIEARYGDQLAKNAIKTDGIIQSNPELFSNKTMHIDDAILSIMQFWRAGGTETIRTTDSTEKEPRDANLSVEGKIQQSLILLADHNDSGIKYDSSSKMIKFPKLQLKPITDFEHIIDRKAAFQQAAKAMRAIEKFPGEALDMAKNWAKYPKGSKEAKTGKTLFAGAEKLYYATEPLVKQAHYFGNAAKAIIRWHRIAAKITGKKDLTKIKHKSYKPYDVEQKEKGLYQPPPDAGEISIPPHEELFPAPKEGLPEHQIWVEHMMQRYSPWRNKKAKV